MTTKSKSSETVKESGGFMSFLRNSYKTGMDAAESMQHSAIEIPLVMLETVGVSEDKTAFLRDKNRRLVRGMVAPIENIVSKFVEVGADQVDLLTDKAAKAKEEIES